MKLIVVGLVMLVGLSACSASTVHPAANQIAPVDDRTGTASAAPTNPDAARIRAATHNLSQLGGPVTRASAVATTLGAVDHTNDRTKVFYIRAEGTFVWTTTTGPPGHKPPHGHFAVIVLRLSDLATVETGLDQSAVDPATLGSAFPL